MKKIAVALILGVGNKVLMGQRRDNKKWSLPAGAIEENETPLQGLIREVKEETGLDVVHAKLIHVGKTPFGTEINSFICKVEGTIDTSKDPDQEFPNLSWEDPKTKDLHVPYARSYALQWLEKNC
jgi:8-oxo-dGTP pyrophosphatase MutT (NUDIX family)